MSLPEVLLWQRLRGASFGMRFRRQHPIGPYVADFACIALRLAIEVDGEVHGRGDRPAIDAARDRFLEGNGWRVLHFTAVQVLKEMDAVLTSIGSWVASPLHQPAAGPPPRAGEDFR